MNYGPITLSDLNEVIDFIKSTEKCEHSIVLIRPGDVSEYNGKSVLSVLLLIGWNIEVQLDESDFDCMHNTLMKYRVTSQKTGWSDYVMRQYLDAAFKTGRDETDGQHAELIRLLNYFADACDHNALRQAKQIFAHLKELLESHFVSEMQMMDGTGFPAAEEHFSQHGTLTAFVKEIESELCRPDVRAEELSASVYRKFFPAFFSHIRDYDIPLCRYLAGCAGGAAKDRKVS